MVAGSDETEYPRDGPQWRDISGSGCEPVHPDPEPRVSGAGEGHLAESVLGKAGADLEARIAAVVGASPRPDHDAVCDQKGVQGGNGSTYVVEGDVPKYAACQHDMRGRDAQVGVRCTSVRGSHFDARQAEIGGRHAGMLRQSRVKFDEQRLHRAAAVMLGKYRQHVAPIAGADADHSPDAILTTRRLGQCPTKITLDNLQPARQR